MLTKKRFAPRGPKAIAPERLVSAAASMRFPAMSFRKAVLKLAASSKVSGGQSRRLRETWLRCFRHDGNATEWNARSARWHAYLSLFEPHRIAGQCRRMFCEQFCAKQNVFDAKERVSGNVIPNSRNCGNVPRAPCLSSLKRLTLMFHYRVRIKSIARSYQQASGLGSPAPFFIMSRVAEAGFASQGQRMASATSAPTAGDRGLPLTVTRQT